MTCLHRIKMFASIIEAPSQRSQFEPNCRPENDPLHDTHSMKDHGRTHQLCELLHCDYDHDTLIPTK
ncbi:hypothetical protein [Ferrimonas pelagia]|uniref:Uncharacterized protein n=1 Tax=Ferrimonas pelagia TaxID=1177826 RepID=A0ABP9EJM7_9GAMM